jgi:hypothetical protein
LPKKTYEGIQGYPQYRAQVIYSEQNIVGMFYLFQF